MTELSRVLLGSILVVTIGAFAGDALAKTTVAKTTAQPRLRLGKGQLKAYRARVQEMVYRALKQEAKGDAGLKAMLQGAKEADIRFSTKAASTARYRKGRALLDTGLTLRELSFSLDTRTGKLRGTSDLIVDKSGKIQQRSIGENWYNDRLSLRLP